MDVSEIADSIKALDTVIDGELESRNMRIGSEKLEFLYIDLVQLNTPDNPNDLRTSAFFRRKSDNRLIEIRIHSNKINVVVANEQPIWDLLEDGTGVAGEAYDDGT